SDFEPAAATDFALEVARDGDILGREIGLDLRAALYKDILARLDRATRVALDAHPSLRAIAAIEKDVGAYHALGDLARARRGLGGGAGCGHGRGRRPSRDGRRRHGRRLSKRRGRSGRWNLVHRWNRRARRRRAEIGAWYGLLLSRRVGARLQHARHRRPKNRW